MINAAALWAVNVWPGWSALSILTDDTERVLTLVNLASVVALVANLVYLWHDSARVRALGGLVTTVTGLLAAARMLQVFPFDLDDPWTTVVRILLVLAVVGSAIAIVVNLVAW